MAAPATAADLAAMIEKDEKTSQMYLDMAGGDIGAAVELFFSMHQDGGVGLPDRSSESSSDKSSRISEDGLWLPDEPVVDKPPPPELRKSPEEVKTSRGQVSEFDDPPSAFLPPPKLRAMRSVTLAEHWAEGKAGILPEYRAAFDRCCLNAEVNLPSIALVTALPPLATRDIFVVFFRGVGSYVAVFR